MRKRPIIPGESLVLNFKTIRTCSSRLKNLESDVYFHLFTVSRFRLKWSAFPSPNVLDEREKMQACAVILCSSMLLLTYLCYRVDFMLIYILFCMYIHITHCPRYQCFVSSVNIIEGENHTCSSSYYAHIMSATPYYQKLICHKETAQRWISFYSSVQCTVLNFLQPAVWKPVYWRDWESTKNWYWNIVLHT